MSQPDPMDSLVRTPLGLPSVHMQGLASHLHDFREQASLGQDPPETVLSKRIVVALEFVHRGDLFADVFGAEARQSFDWECVNSNLENGSMVEPLEVAIAALQLVSFRLSMTPADVSERSRESPLAFMLETVAENPELRGLSPQHVYRLHVLTNQMTVLDKLNAVEVYTSLALRRATARASTNLMARLASRKFKVQQYHDDFVAMFRDASYEVDTLRRCETRFRRAGEEQPPDARTERGHRGAAAGEKLNFAGRRPCLLEIIQDSDPAGSGALARLALENSADGANTFESFCNFVPFHASLSARSRKLVYFLAAQRHIPVLEHIEAVTSFQSTREHLKKVAITHPQVSVITDVLLSLRYCGEPFPALQAFHTECVRKHFSVDVVRNIINRSLLLRLYLCAYQHPAIWRECWRRCMTAASAKLANTLTKEQENAVERFTLSAPLDVESAVRCLITSVQADRARGL